MSLSRFAARLKELRLQSGLSQKALAERAGVSQNAVSKWEQDVAEPSWGNVIALADAFGVGTDAFQREPLASGKTERGRPRKGQPEVSSGNGAAPKKGRKKGKDAGRS